jgi:hypothetical protein
VAEYLCGVFESLSYARRLDYQEVELNVDSMTLIQDVATNKSHSFVDCSLVKKMRKMLEMN